MPWVSPWTPFPSIIGWVSNARFELQLEYERSWQAVFPQNRHFYPGKSTSHVINPFSLGGKWCQIFPRPRVSLLPDGTRSSMVSWGKRGLYINIFQPMERWDPCKEEVLWNPWLTRDSTVQEISPVTREVSKLALKINIGVTNSSCPRPEPNEMGQVRDSKRTTHLLN